MSIVLQTSIACSPTDAADCPCVLLPRASSAGQRIYCLRLWRAQPLPGGVLDNLGIFCDEVHVTGMLSSRRATICIIDKTGISPRTSTTGVVLAGEVVAPDSRTSLKDMARVHYPLLAPLVQSQFDTLSDTTAVKQPVLVLHSADDEVVPYSHGKKLFQAVTGPGRLVELHGDHNSGFLKSKSSYVSGLTSFLNTHFPASKR